MANADGRNVPMPRALKLAAGQRPGRDSGGRVVAEGPNFEREIPDKPDWLPKEASLLWDRVVPELHKLGVLKRLDYTSLVSYVLTWDRMLEAQRDIDENGVVRPGPQGVSKNPAVTVMEGASRELRQWAREFGLTPSAEARLANGDNSDGDDNPFAG